MENVQKKQSLVGIMVMTTIALIAFASNSVLCRMALQNGSIDPASFTAVRVIAGAVTLVTLLSFRRSKPTRKRPNWTAGFSLFIYMAFFSVAYIALEAGIGALILFGFVQLTMLSVAILRRDQFPPIAWFGFLISAIGIIYLLRPGNEAPNLFSSLQMALAGIGWGAYSLIGKGSTNPLHDTGKNFILCIPLVVVLVIIFWPELNLDSAGVFLAAASGALASGCGYAIWYWCLPRLKTFQAAVLQLSVPIIASVGGVAFLGEEISLRLGISSVLVLGGIAIVLASSSQNNKLITKTNYPQSRPE